MAQNPQGVLEDLEYDGQNYGEYDDYHNNGGYEHGYDEQYYDEGNYEPGHYHEGGHYDQHGNWYDDGAHGDMYDEDGQYYYDEEHYPEHYDPNYHDYGPGYDEEGNEIYHEDPNHYEPSPRDQTGPSSNVNRGPPSNGKRPSSGARAPRAALTARSTSEDENAVVRVPAGGQRVVVASNNPPDKSGKGSYAPAESNVANVSSKGASGKGSQEISKPATASMSSPAAAAQAPVPTTVKQAPAQAPTRTSMIVESTEKSKPDKPGKLSSTKSQKDQKDQLVPLQNPDLVVDTSNDAKPVFNNFRSPVVVRLGSEGLTPKSNEQSPAQATALQPALPVSNNSPDSRPSSTQSVRSNKILPAGVPVTSPFSKQASIGGIPTPAGDRPSSSKSSKSNKIAPSAMPVVAPLSSSISPKAPEYYKPDSKPLEANMKTFDSKPNKSPDNSYEMQKSGASRGSSGSPDDNSGSDLSGGGKKAGSLAKMLSLKSQNSFSGEGGAMRRRRCFSGNKKSTSFLNAVCITAHANPMVFIASADSSTHVFDAMTGDEVHTMTGHSDRVLCLASSVPGEVYFAKHAPPQLPALNGKHFIVSGGRDENMCIWDADNFKNLHTLHAHKGPVWAVAAVIIGDMGYAISSSSSGSIRIWDAVSGAKIFNLKGQKGKVLSLCILDRRAPVVSLLSCGEDKNIHVWDIVAGRHLKLLEGHEEEVTTVAAANFQQLASMQSIEVATKATMKATNKLITLIVSGSRDKSVRVWDYEQGIALFVLGGHLGAIFGVSIAVTLRTSIKTAVNTPIVISGSEDGSVILWSLETGKAIKEMKGHVNSIKGLATSLVEATPGVYDREMLVVTCGWDKTVHFFDVDDTINTDDAGCKCAIM